MKCKVRFHNIYRGVIMKSCPPVKRREEKRNQRRTIWCEFEPIGLTLLKNPLSAGWGLLPTFKWVGSCLLYIFDIHVLCGVGILVNTRSCVLSSFFLLNIRYMRYLMAIWWMVFIVFIFISGVGICRFSRSFMLLVWMAPLTLVVITMRGLIFQPCALIASTNGLYLSSFVCMAWFKESIIRAGEFNGLDG